MLKYRIEDSSYGIAIWLNLLVEEVEISSEGSVFLAGNVIRDLGSDSLGYKPLFLMVFLLFLFCFLIFLIFYRNICLSKLLSQDQNAQIE